MDKIIYCKDCIYCDTGINEEKEIFYKCLAGHSYGGTTPDDFCSHAKLKINLQEILKELYSAITFANSCSIIRPDFVPVRTDIVNNLIKYLEK